MSPSGSPGFSPARAVLAPDFDLIQQHCSSELAELRDGRVFLTGGTGFMGKWLLETFFQVNQTGGSPIRATILTRDPAAFASRFPYLAEHGSFDFLAGDLQNFQLPGREYTHFIHLASQGLEGTTLAASRQCLASIVQGTLNTIDQAARCSHPRFLFTSTGAVYGKNPNRTGTIHEDCPDAPDPRDPISVYGEGKRLAEYFCLQAGSAGLISPVIARCFSFLGPYLADSQAHAAWSFLNAALNGQPIRIQGDGTPIRSYLYPADLTIWLIKLLVRGPAGMTANVGAEQPVSVADLAREIAGQAASHPEVQVLGRSAGGLGASVYVPDTSLIRSALGVAEYTPREKAISKTLAWMQAAKE